MTRLPVAPPLASVIILVQRNGPQAVRAIQSVVSSTNGTLNFEIIVLLNGADQTTITHVQRGAGSIARILLSEANLGFGGGCNFCAAYSDARYLVFLNDDVIVDPGWLEALIRCAHEDQSIAAVGSRIRFPDGTLQEAGSILWSDGSTAPIGRGLTAAGLAWRFRRDVTYSSACSLLVRRADFVTVGGFDEAYFPAYYEDVDLCLALLEIGKRVVFEPASELVHFESQSTVNDFKMHLFKRNRRRLVSKWATRLLDYEPPDPQNEAAVSRALWRAQGAGSRVLVIDDRLPDAGLGSGYGRMNELLADLRPPSFVVRMFASNDEAPDPRYIGARWAEMIARPVADEIADPLRCYDIAIISRPHNFERFAPLLREFQPQCKVCYDVEALFFRRIEKQAAIESDAERREMLLAQASAGRDLETRIIRESDHIVCISTDERDVIESIPDHPSVGFILPLSRSISWTTQPFREREPNAVFVAGWMAGPHSPNVDALAWFAGEVWPIVLRALPNSTLIVTGGSPPTNALALSSPCVKFVGYVDDLANLYARARVAVSPIRFGAGVKIKTIEALQYGLPVVATTVGSEGINFDGCGAVAITDEAEAYAAAVITALSDEDAWNNRRNAIARQLATWQQLQATTWDMVCESMIS